MAKVRLKIFILLLCLISASGFASAGQSILSDSDISFDYAGFFKETFSYSTAILSGSPEMVVSVSNSTFESYTQRYSWTYDGHNQSISISIPKEDYDYYRDKTHTKKDFRVYALSEDDRQILSRIGKNFQEQGRRYKFTEDQTALNVVAFVQSIPYTSDSATTGYVEYPRYPLETLADGGGDCEDKVILAAALLSEMGYETVLIKVSNHIALGIKSDTSLSETYYEYDGGKYYYIETTVPGYRVGKIPLDYEGLDVKILPMNSMPFTNVTINAVLVDYDRDFASYSVRCTVTNSGQTPAQNVLFSVYAEESSYDTTQLLPGKIDISIDTIPAEGSWQTESVFTIPRRNFICFSSAVTSENFDPVLVHTKTVYIT